MPDDQHGRPRAPADASPSARPGRGLRRGGGGGLLHGRLPGPQQVGPADQRRRRRHPWLLDFWLFWQAAFLPRNLYAIGTVLCLWVWLRKGLRTRAWWAFGTM